MGDEGTGRRSLMSRLGPGLLWAGTAVGVSHLVQSTRAGAGYGLMLAWVVIVAHLTKYPAYEAGSRYVAATGRSLLEGYRRQGRWAVWLFIAVTVATMAIVEAAVTIVTAGMAGALISDQVGTVAWSAGLLGLCAAILLGGRFSLLDRLMKAMMLVLSVSTLAAVAVLLPSVDWGALSPRPGLPPLEPEHVAFLVAFVGWMPAPFDTAVWHSMWTVEGAREHGGRVSLAEARLDFHVGYGGTAVLALGFVFLGAAVLHGSGHTVPAAAPAFAALLVDLYTEALGPWARPVILVAAFATMLSTTLAVSDGFPRALSGAVAALSGPEDAPVAPTRRAYGVCLGLLMAGGLGIIWFFAANLKALVDFATTVSFVVAPVLAVLNLRAVTGPEVPEDHRPQGLLWWAHLGCIVLLTVFSLAYLGWRYLG